MKSPFFADGNCSLGGIGQMQNKMQLYSLGFGNILHEMPRNLATLSSSAASSSFGPGKAVDTDVTTWYCSTFNEINSWWRVDLGSMYYVHTVDVYPRDAFDDAYFFHQIEVGTKKCSLSNPWCDSACSLAIQAKDQAYRSYQASPYDLTCSAFITAGNVIWLKE
ncbi:hypothetical protein SK128_012171 [Halocaridina rubra]|uniref:F5/8 type C domain-containing protein n=1 Tax=Halocaridina rubra TaxID=373956 RepID=A0AAN8WWB3_HALRR